MALAALVALPFLGALLLAVVPEPRRVLAAALAGAVAVAATAIVIAQAPAVFDGAVPTWSVPWMPTLGLDLGLRMDGLAWLFALLICAIGALVVLYAAWYLDRADPAARFFMYLLAFMGAMLGIVLADNLILLAVFWEATSLSSFLLIGYWNKREDAREGARMALAITGGGGLALLGAMLLIGLAADSFRLADVLAAGDTLRASPLYLPALVLLLLAAFTKSAQFPFHFWLPSAMAAPTPVSAYLHSATMVKAGVFLLARFWLPMGGTDAWFYLVTLTGLATLLVGAWCAIFQHDLKGLLAYSTISQLGLITLLFGLDEPLAVVAGVFHIINHATFKASLFMAAGIIDHETGTRDMRKLNGLARYMPWTAALASVAAAAMAGVPLLNGFLSKEMFLGVTLEKAAHPVMDAVLPVGAAVAGILAVAYSLRFVHDVFFNGTPVDLPKMPPHEPPALMRVPVEILVVLCLVVGLAPAVTVGPLLQAAAQAAVLGPAGGTLPAYTLALWHGFNLPLALSILALVGGTLLYFGLQRVINLHRLSEAAATGRRLFQAGYRRALAVALELTRALQNGSLQRYLLLLVLTALAAGAWPFIAGSARLAVPVDFALTPTSAMALAVWSIGMFAAVGAAVQYRRRLLSLVLLGAVGLTVSLAFVALSAPDLALTQLLVEVVTIMLMMLALRWLPAESPPERGRLLRLVHLVVAVAAGAGAALLVLLVLGRDFDSISPYFLQTAVKEGGGANVVNVILVDYRGYDTLGEITVLAIAGLIIWGLMSAYPLAAGTAAGQQVQAEQARTRPLMLRIIVPAMLPVAVLASFFLFMRGHNLPGGGFIAGLLLAIALMLQFVAGGIDWAGARSRNDYRPWIGAGLLVAVLTGVASWPLGSPFLTSTYDYPVWPIVGAVPLASAALFDLGVYLTVTGAAMVALLAIARPGVKR